MERNKIKTPEDVINVLKRQSHWVYRSQIDIELFKLSENYTLLELKKAKGVDFWERLDNIKVSLEDMQEYFNNIPKEKLEDMYENKNGLYWEAMDIKKNIFTLNRINSYLNKKI